MRQEDSGDRLGFNTLAIGLAQKAMEEDRTNREMSVTGMFKASVGRIWQVWSESEHIVHWWGPAGFSSTIHKMDFTEEGEWDLTMHGPDGTNYPNRSIYKEIVPLRKIVFEHFNPHFITTVIFEEKGGETYLNWTLLFDSVEMYNVIVKAHKADEGQRQNMEKLRAYLATL